VVQLESGGEPVEIDGFRLRDPAHWVAPQPPAFSELWHISNACNMRCPFCYEEGDPEGCTVLADRAGMVTMSEIETRLKYRDPRLGELHAVEGLVIAPAGEEHRHPLGVGHFHGRFSVISVQEMVNRFA